MQYLQSLDCLHADHTDLDAPKCMVLVLLDGLDGNFGDDFAPMRYVANILFNKYVRKYILTVTAGSKG